MSASEAIMILGSRGANCVAFWENDQPHLKLVHDGALDVPAEATRATTMQHCNHQDHLSETLGSFQWKVASAKFAKMTVKCRIQQTLVAGGRTSRNSLRHMLLLQSCIRFSKHSSSTKNSNSNAQTV